MIGLGSDKNEQRYKDPTKKQIFNSVLCHNCSELKWVPLVWETFWKVDNCNWPIPTTTVSLLPRAKTRQVNFNCTKRTLWFWILDFIFAFEWAEKMFVVNQHGKDSYFGNTQAFCRETNHKKRNQVYFNLNFLLKGFILLRKLQTFSFSCITKLYKNSAAYEPSLPSPLLHQIDDPIFSL